MFTFVLMSEGKITKETKLVRLDKQKVGLIEGYKARRGGVVCDYIERGIELVMEELEAKDRFLEERNKK